MFEGAVRPEQLTSKKPAKHVNLNFSAHDIAEYNWLADFQWNEEPLGNTDKATITKGKVQDNTTTTMFFLGSGRYSFNK